MENIKSLLNTKQVRLILILLPITYCIYLIVQHFNGGVPAHHFLANESYPEISNWFGLPIIVVFSYFTYRYFYKKMFTPIHIIELTIAFIYGLGIFLCFKEYIKIDATYLFIGLFLIGIIYPIYRIHIYFSIVLGMTYGFGAVLPTAMIGLAVLLSFIAHRIREIILNFYTTKNKSTSHISPD